MTLNNSQQFEDALEMLIRSAFAAVAKGAMTKETVIGIIEDHLSIARDGDYDNIELE